MKKNIKKKKNNLYVYLYVIVLLFTFFWWFAFVRVPEDLNKYICRDNDLVEYSIKAYRQNMSELAKFHHKRMFSCIDLMEKYKDNTGYFNRMNKCSIIDAATDSAVPLVQLLMSNDENSTAKGELIKLLQSMQPYNYCPQYESNLRTIVKYKKLLDF